MNSACPSYYIPHLDTPVDGAKRKGLLYSARAALRAKVAPKKQV